MVKKQIQHPTTPSAAGAFFQADEDHVRLSFKTRCFNDTGRTGGKMLFAVDNSSSMGNDFESVKRAVRYMMGEQHAEAPSFILYNTRASFATAEQMLSSRPCGSTSFEAAFKLIQQFVSEQPADSHVSVVFMTDGQDTSSRNFNESHAMFKAFLANCYRQVVVHTLGFGRGHNRTFLQGLACMGSSPGCYRYAESGTNGQLSADSLDDSFATMFDFLVQNVKLSIRMGSLSFDVDAVKEEAEGTDAQDEECENEGAHPRLAFDVVLRREAVQSELGAMLDSDSDSEDEGEGEGEGERTLRVVVVAGSATDADAPTAEVLLTRAGVDAMFTVRAVEESEVTSAEDLERLQKRLNSVDPFKAYRIGRVDKRSAVGHEGTLEEGDGAAHRRSVLVRKAMRAQLTEARQLVQQKLDKYSCLFANIARGIVDASSGSVAAQLHSLRHETKFTKARRARSMEKRARDNVGHMMRIGLKLEKLHRTLDLRPFEQLERQAQAETETEIQRSDASASTSASAGVSRYSPSLVCALSGDGLVEMVRDSAEDVMVFALSVVRPEEAVDAPTSVLIRRICAGTYSNEAFTASTKFAVAQSGGSTAAVTGGFVESRKPSIYDVHPSSCSSDSAGPQQPRRRQAEEVGVFRGPDGQLMNACLPLYLTDQHWARVRPQLPAMLGYFFTLDPLGFHERQYIALYMILGEMHAMRANANADADVNASSRAGGRGGGGGTSGGSGRAAVAFNSAWADWLIADFTKLCAALLPTAEAVIVRWKQRNSVRPSATLTSASAASAAAGGSSASADVTVSGDGDLLADFLRGPAGRTKELVPNLLVVIGWRIAKQLATSSDGSDSGDGKAQVLQTEALAAEKEKQEQEQEARFRIALVEEIWRRNFCRYYKQHPAEAVNELLEKLLYGPEDGAEPEPETETEAEAEAGVGETAKGNQEVEVKQASTKAERRSKRAKKSSNDPAIDRPFATFAALKWGTLSRRDQQCAVRAFGKDGERPPQLKVAANGGSSGEDGGFRPRRLAAYSAHAAFFDELVHTQLKLIEPMNRHLSALLDGLPLGLGRAGAGAGAAVGFSGEQQRLVLVQALRFRTNSAANSGVSSGEYKNTFDFGSAGEAGNNGGEGCISELLAEIHQGFEQRRRESWAAAAEAKRELRQATAIALSRDAAAFAGKLMAVCPTRGGGTFNALASILASGVVEDDQKGRSKVVAVPLLEKKVRALLTGRIAVGTEHASERGARGEEYVCLSAGQAWMSCPIDLVTRLRHVVGEEAFVAIELDMRGSWGHVYRESDIPNRHGHCNSNPNTALGGRFTGFRV